VLLAALAERLGTTDFGRLFVVAAASGGTLLATFAVVINNHLIAAVSVAAALYPTVCIWYDGERRLRHFAAAGLFAAFAAANELPALSFLALCGAALLWKAPRQTLLGFVPAAAVIVAAFLGTEYIAHGSIRPPYMHRAEGQDWTQDNWYNYTYERGGRTITSYWVNRETKSKVDQGEDSPGTYVLHALVGHHGVFSLTPVWLLTIVGLALWLRGRHGGWQALALAILLLSAVCLTFYLSRPLQDRNYGGTSSGFRWILWFAPMWLLAMLPAADTATCCRTGRGIALVLLVLSALSASYPTWNPWTHPWLVNWMVHMGWLAW
jgi:hypothetical protein